jgi:hypothetical protein
MRLAAATIPVAGDDLLMVVHVVAAGSGGPTKHSRYILMPKGRKLTPSVKPSDLFEDIRHLIEQARAATARAINSAVTLLYWQV